MYSDIRFVPNSRDVYVKVRSIVGTFYWNKHIHKGKKSLLFTGYVPN